MPHLQLEYSDNLNIDTQPLLAALHQTLCQSGVFSPVNIKCRARACANYYCDTHCPAFAHITLSIISGRDATVKQAITTALLATLQAHLPDAPAGTQMSVDLRDMQSEWYAKATST